LTEDNFVRTAILAKGGLTTATDHGSGPSFDGGYLMKVCHAGNPTGSTVGMRFEEAPGRRLQPHWASGGPARDQRGFSWWPFSVLSFDVISVVH